MGRSGIIVQHFLGMSALHIAADEMDSSACGLGRSGSLVTSPLQGAGRWLQAQAPAGPWGMPWWGPSGSRVCKLSPSHGGAAELAPAGPCCLLAGLLLGA